MSPPMAAPRFEVSSLAGQIIVRAEEPKHDRRKCKELPFGSIRIPYQEYRTGGHRYWMLFYYQGGKRIREARSSWDKLKKRAEEIATSIANGQVAMAAFTEADRAGWRRCQEIAASTGQAPELLIARIAELIRKLGDVDPEAAVDFFLEYRPKQAFSMNIPDLVEQFLAAKEPEICGGWYDSLKDKLHRFAAYCTGPLQLLSSAQLNEYLRALKSKPHHGHGAATISARTRHNHREAIQALATWSQANGYLPRTWLELEHVADPGTRIGTIRILTPDELTRLLIARQNAEQLGRARKKSMIPFLALQAFAGIRHEELNGEEGKPVLDWSTIHLDSSRPWLYVPAEVAKTRIDRTVPISPNLASWLEPYAHKSGQVCQLYNTSSALTRAKAAARLDSGKGQTHNVLRHSYCSYRLAIVKHIGQVAEEVGNSPGIIRKHYRRCIPADYSEGDKSRPWPMEEEAARWFGIMPERADVLPLFSWRQK